MTQMEPARILAKTPILKQAMEAEGNWSPRLPCHKDADVSMTTGVHISLRILCALLPQHALNPGHIPEDAEPK